MKLAPIKYKLHELAKFRSFALLSSQSKTLKRRVIFIDDLIRATTDNKKYECSLNYPSVSNKRSNQNISVLKF